MINNKLFNKLTKKISKEVLDTLGDLSVIQNSDGSYHLFNKYNIQKVNDTYVIQMDKIAGNKIFYVLKNAVTWCTYDKKNNIYESNRIFDLDKKLASLDTSILVHQRLAKNTKKMDDKLMYLAKLGEEKMQHRILSEELTAYVESARIWQNKRFNVKSA
jgi:hypothetical protein